MTTQTPEPQYAPQHTPEPPTSYMPGATAPVSPPPPGYGPPSAKLPPADLKRINRRNWITLGIVGVLALAAVIIVAIAAAVSPTPQHQLATVNNPAPPAVATTTPAAPPTTEAAPKAAEPTKPAAAPPANQLNKPVRDGKFEFTVMRVDYGIPIQGQTPQGQFVAVTVTVKNIGKEPQTMFDGNQEALSANGAKYRADSAAGIYLNSADQSVWITPINPGNAVTGKIVFDVPKDVKLAKLKLHDSMLSGGATVTIG